MTIQGHQNSDYSIWKRKNKTVETEQDNNLDFAFHMLSDISCKKLHFDCLMCQVSVLFSSKHISNKRDICILEPT
jgi:hypothetical protein